MKYFEVNFIAQPCNETITDVLAALTAEIGFESFVPDEKGMQAYIQQSLFDEEALKEVIRNFPMEDVSLSYTITEPEDKDWNEEWEKNFFQPIVIGDRCVIHSTFHKDYPQAEYDIVINPHMAFGTGHQETTSSILGELLDADLKGKSVLDMGCGTGILSILAAKTGAREITGIDIDEWAYNNAMENIRANGLNNITIKIGDARLLEAEAPFDVILANINRNIVVEDMPHYVARLLPQGLLIMSGFYLQDLPLIQERAAQSGLTFMTYREDKNWVAASFYKN